VATVKITVLKRMLNQDLADEFCAANVTVPCPNFTEGQEFVVEGGRQQGAFAVQPGRIFTRATWSSSTRGTFSGWMKDDDTIIACCSDGLRLVVFEVKRISD